MRVTPEVPGFGPVLAVVLAAPAAVAPPGVDPTAFAEAALADCYEVVADLHLVGAAVATCAGEPWPSDRHLEELLWPGDPRFTVPRAATADLRLLADAVLGPSAEAPGRAGLVVIPPDVPDLPQLILAKLVRGLLRADLVTAPETGGDGLAGLACRLPWPGWIADRIGLDHDPHEALLGSVPRRSLLARAPGWHRLRTPTGVHALDPGLEGWEQTRLLLGG